MTFKLHPRLPVFLRSTDGGATWRIFDEETSNPACNAHGHFLDGGGFAGDSSAGLPLNGAYSVGGELVNDDNGPRFGVPPLERSCFARRLNQERGLPGRVRLDVISAGTSDSPTGQANGQMSDVKEPVATRWRFEAGGFYCGDKFYPLSGTQLALLAVFIKFPNRRTYDYDALRVAWQDQFAEKSTIRSALSKLRRYLCDNGLAGSGDPIPGKSGVWEFTIPR